MDKTSPATGAGSSIASVELPEKAFSTAEYARQRLRPRAGDALYLHLSDVSKWTGIDRATVFGVLMQAWGLIGGPVTVLLIASRISPELQGLYYAFYSLLGVQAIVELGMNQVILQFASHEWSGLGLSRRGEVEGDPNSRSRLASLFRFSLRWYAWASGLFALALSFGGSMFFLFSSAPLGVWFAPWVGLCLVNSLLFAVVPLWSILEGSGQISRVYGFRLVQNVSVSLATWSCLAWGAGLWTLFAAGLTSLTVATFFLWHYYARFFLSLLQAPVGPRIIWRVELFPLQWKVAISYISGYFSGMTFTLFVFAFQGPVTAGRMGMSWSLVNTLSAVSMMFFVTKVPRFGMLIAQKRFEELDRLFVRCCATSVAVASVGSATIAALVIFLGAHGFHLATRLLPITELCPFLVATIFLEIALAEGMYLRAHKREPLLMLSVATGLLNLAVCFTLGRYFGPLGIGVGNLAVLALVTLPVATLVLHRCRVEWHAVPSYE